MAPVIPSSPTFRLISNAVLASRVSFARSRTSSNIPGHPLVCSNPGWFLFPPLLSPPTLSNPLLSCSGVKAYMTQIMARASALICAIFLFRDATPFVPAAVRTAAHKTKTTTAAARSVITPPVFPTSTTTANTRTCEINRREGWYHVATRSRSKCSFAHPSPSVGDSSGGGGNKMATKPPLKVNRPFVDALYN